MRFDLIDSRLSKIRYYMLDDSMRFLSTNFFYSLTGTAVAKPLSIRGYEHVLPS
jgi:hypothetical protein